MTLSGVIFTFLRANSSVLGGFQSSVVKQLPKLTTVNTRLLNETIRNPRKKKRFRCQAREKAGDQVTIGLGFTCHVKFLTNHSAK